MTPPPTPAPMPACAPLLRPSGPFNPIPPPADEWDNGCCTENSTRCACADNRLNHLGSVRRYCCFRADA
jgi:hypothetical protein